MKIHGVKLENFMLFDKLDAEFSPNVNIICGENSTGKTALIKLLYSCAKDVSVLCTLYKPSEDTTGKQDIQNHVMGIKHELPFPTRIQSVFGLNDALEVHGLIRLPNCSRAHIATHFILNDEANFTKQLDLFESEYGFSIQETPDSKFPRLSKSTNANVIYIPPKEMISATENFTSLYEEYHISFDETYYDLARLLDRPRKKTLSPEMEKVAQSMEALIGGKVRQKGKAFYLDMDGVGELRMSLVSEGYRKLATLLNLVSTGSLSDGAILFWDEPETNMNPRMVEPLVKAILALAGAGVQVFVTTHDYFVQQYFGLAAEYGERFQAGTGNLEYRFLSLNKARTADGAETVTLESASRLLELEHNAVKEEFDAVYNKEVGLIYGDNA